MVTQIHCKCVFATHFHEMTSLARKLPGVENLHVVAHVTPRENGSQFDKDITLLYKVEPGSSDQSYGIQIAELADFPEDVIRLAKRKAEELEGIEDKRDTTRMDSEVTQQGVALVQEFLHAYEDRVQITKRQRKDDKRAELEALESCMHDFDERIRNNVRQNEANNHRHGLRIY